MLYEYFHKKLLESFDFQPTGSQENLCELLSQFLFLQENKKAFLLKGYAGTGKTSTISIFVNLLAKNKFRSVLLAPTGRAAKVLSSYCKMPAFTIHKKIYRQKSSKDGFGKFVLDKNLYKNTLFIVDEGSMIANDATINSVFGSGQLLADLINYVYQGENCSMIIVGDTAQLPPVGIDLSPGLQKPQLESYGLKVTEVILNEVVRQRDSSGILYNATGLREKISKKEVSFPVIQKTDFIDFKRISGEDLIEEISTCFDKYGTEETVIICRSNKRANKYNQGIRSSILFREEEITPGDLLMVVKNNYYWMEDHDELGFIANGDIIQLQRIRKYHDLYNYRFADCTVKLIDYDLELDVKIMLDVLSSESAALTTEQNKELFYAVLEDYSHLQTRKKQYDSVKTNEFFNALQIKHAQAITCHKAQGGQWKAVFIDAGYLTREMIDIEYLRWFYTAITRATEVVYLVNFPEFVFQKSL